MPGRHRRTFFAAPIGTATPNTVYAQQAATTRRAATPSGGSKYCACRPNHFWRLQVLRLPHKQEPRPSGDQARRKPKYCACHADRSRGPAATRRAASPSGRSKYCACHADRRRGPAATRRAASLDRSCGPAATSCLRGRRSTWSLQKGFWRAWSPWAAGAVLGASRKGSGAPGRRGRAATLSGGSKYCACHADRSRGPAATRRAATPSGGSNCCACHAAQRRPGAPQRLPPATQTGAAAQRRPGAPPFSPAIQTGAAAQRRPNPFWRLQVLCLPHGQEPRPSGDQARRNPF